MPQLLPPKHRLLCPGPTPVPDEVKAAMLQHNVYHRTSEFYAILDRCRTRLAPFLGSSRKPLILSASGTGAMEAAVTNLTNPGDKVISIDCGKFGERWTELLQVYQCDTDVKRLQWGDGIDSDYILNHAQEIKAAKAIFLQANDTSSGVAPPLESVCQAIRQVTPNTLIVVDAISSLVAQKMEMDAWGIDCVVAGSQKGFGIPPGLSFIVLSKRAEESITDRPRFYFNLKLELAEQDKGATAWTSATNLILGLDAALSALTEVGVENLLEHHRVLAEACRSAIRSIGLQLLPKVYYSNAVTAALLPENIDGEALLKSVRKNFGAILAGGQGPMKGKLVRIAHLGFCDQLDLISGFAAFEMGLYHCGFKEKDLGTGTAALMKFLAS